MANLAQTMKAQAPRWPEVIAWVSADPSGVVIEAVGEIDGEASAAVIAVIARALSGAGELLGLGSFNRASVTGAGLSCVIAMHERDLLAVYVDPTKPVGTFEKKLDGLIRK